MNQKHVYCSEADFLSSRAIRALIPVVFLLALTVDPHDRCELEDGDVD